MSKHTGITMVHVPYRGSAPGMTDLLAGRVDLMFDYSIVVKPQIDGGKLRALAQTGATRMVSHADVPTFVELGYKDVQFAAWATLVGPAGMPQPIVDKLAAAFNATLKDPAIIKYHDDQGVTLMPDVGRAEAAGVHRQRDGEVQGPDRTHRRDGGLKRARHHEGCGARH